MQEEVEEVMMVGFEEEEEPAGAEVEEPRGVSGQKPGGAEVEEKPEGARVVEKPGGARMEVPGVEVEVPRGAKEEKPGGGEMEVSGGAEEEEVEQPGRSRKCKREVRAKESGRMGDEGDEGGEDEDEAIAVNQKSKISAWVVNKKWSENLFVY